MSNNLFELTFASEIVHVKNVLKQVMLFLEQNYPQLSMEDELDFKLIFSELLCNAVIHGNKHDVSKNVYIRVHANTEGMHVSIEDEGPGFDFAKLLAKNVTDQNLGGESGRGIRIVNSMVENLTFENEGREIKFFKRVSPNG